jgi:2-iminoacetate synthase
MEISGGFLQIFQKENLESIQQKILSRTKQDVEIAIQNSIQNQKSWEDFCAFISPAADSYLEVMAKLSQEITLERFGKTILLYMPLYLSNECRSSCLYCGFSYENKIPRKTLTEKELQKEAVILKKKGIDHILILTGEDYSKTPISYISSSIKLLKQYFSSVSIEIYPMDTDDYKQLIDAGADGLTIYQETYDIPTYKAYHIRGMKKNMEYRLDAPDRGGKAGFRKIGVGALLGLSDPLQEIYFLGLHVNHLIKTYWKTQILVSLPRLRPAKGDFQKSIFVSDREFLRFITAFRIYFRDIGLVLSTREPTYIRDNFIGLGITQMSAGSKTEPGGYQGLDTLEQFSIEDTRDLPTIIELLRKKGYDPVIKDFDRAFT